MAHCFLGEGKIEVDIGKIEHEHVIQRGELMEKVREYCLKDSDILYRCVDKLFREAYLTPFRIKNEHQEFNLFTDKAFYMTAS